MMYYYVLEVAQGGSGYGPISSYAAAEEWRDICQAKTLAEGHNLRERRFAVRHESLFREGL